MGLAKSFGADETPQDGGCPWYLCIFHKHEIETGKLPSWVIPAPAAIYQETPTGAGRLNDLQLGVVSAADVKKHIDPVKGNRHGGTHKGAITLLCEIPEPPPWAQPALQGKAPKPVVGP
jgi:hypothetical protein